MGRRKIEIQPITHERNRSVTFLKRKNGLFKKAYELGVLCSVDVAVIIFEERQGHHVKLYQYCSTDVHDIVQRHIRYDGEKDTRTPVDFSNNPNSKLDDVGEGDEDDIDDDDGQDIVTRGGRKGSSGNGKIKTEFNTSNGKMMPGNNDLSLDVNMDYHLQSRPMTIPPPPMPLHHTSQLSPTTGGSSLPISGERHNPSLLARGGQPQHGSMPNKRPRLVPSPGMGKDDPNSYGYHTSSNAGFRHPQQQPQPQAPQFNPFLPGSPPPPPQSTFLSGLSFEFPGPAGTQASRPPARVNYPAPRSGQYPPDQGMYQQLIRQAPSQHQAHHSHPSANGQPDLFAAFLDADEQRQSQNHAQQFSSLDWPVHSAPQPTQQEQAPNPPPSANTQDSTWLDFLSGAPPPVGPPARADGVSWERDRPDGDVYRSDGQRASSRKSPTSSNASSALSPTTNHKRPRADSTVKTEDGKGESGIDADVTAPPGRSIANGRRRSADRERSHEGEAELKADGEE